MPSQVFFGSARQARLEAKETLPAKLDLILERLRVRDRVKGETVAIKMHTGNNIGYSTVHPLFVRKVAQAVKEGGGKPFVTDVNWDVRGAEERGYSSERWVARFTRQQGRTRNTLTPTSVHTRASRSGNLLG